MTRYFEEQVLRKRPETDPAWCDEVIPAPLRREEQADGRIRFWGEVNRAGEATPRILRVVTLADGETVRNASIVADTERPAMKLHYYPETDSLHIVLNAAPSAETREVADGVNVGFDAAGRPVGFDIDHASTKLDLTTLGTSALPFHPTKAA